MKDSGIYLLIIKLSKNDKIKIGKLGRLDFQKGFYIYTGSALNGLNARIKRHKSKQKKNFWHIDYLLASKNAKILNVFTIKTNKKLECTLNRKVSILPNAKLIKEFGCSDCRCKSHLIYFRKDYFKKLIRIRL